MPPRGLPLFIVLALGLAACKAPAPRDGAAPAANAPIASADAALADSPYYAVTVKRAAFFSHSPIQPGGPDRGLPKDEEVEMVQKEPLYSRVRTRTGAEGYIANDQIRPLPPPPPLPPEPIFPLGPSRLVPSPDNPGRLQIVPLDEMINAAEPPLPVSEPPASSPVEPPAPPTP